MRRSGASGVRSWSVGAALATVPLVLALALAAPARATCGNEGFRTGPSAHLPDCRAYEQVTPGAKGEFDALTVGEGFPVQSNACEPGEPCRLIYSSAANVLEGARGNSVPNADLAQREGTGWRSTSLTPPTPDPPANAVSRVDYAFSPSLERAILKVPLQRLTPEAPAGVFNLFRRDESGAYTLVTDVEPPTPPVPGCFGCFNTEDLPIYVGGSTDLERVVFEANDSLVEGAPGGEVENLYTWNHGRLVLAGVLPDGTVPPHGATAGAGISLVSPVDVERAVSDDGGRVVFGALADGGPPAAQQDGLDEVYERNGNETVEASAPAANAQPGHCETKQGICDPEPARFWTASSDGGTVFFTSKAALTARSFTGDEERSAEELEEEQREREEEELEEPGLAKRRENPGEDLYRYELSTHTLTDLTVDSENPSDPNGAEVLAVLGASRDGSYVYFVAHGQLGGHGLSGRPSLYVWHGSGGAPGTIAFIATLAPPSEEEQERTTSPESDLSDWTDAPGLRQSYLTPDGRHLAFVSVNSLTGYDNRDAATGKPDHEVYEYDAETAALTCVSCDPSGARPIGSAFIGAGPESSLDTPYYQPRTLDDQGTRAFFGSPDALTTGIAAGVARVYEYEAGSPHLLSGQGGEESSFLDASASGEDVFFAAREQLAPSDTDNLLDVYDARVGGGLPLPAVPTGPCSGEACRPLEPEATSQPTLASASPGGAGNLSQPPVPTARKPTRKQLLAKALARCRRIRNRRKRARCVAAARAHYGSRVRSKSPRRRGSRATRTPG